MDDEMNRQRIVPRITQPLLCLCLSTAILSTANGDESLSIVKVVEDGRAEYQFMDVRGESFQQDVRSLDGDRRQRTPSERMRRAGSPLKISRLAAPSVNARRYSGGYTGGGAATLGKPRRVYQDGTWGVDYHGWPLHRRIWLGWRHGRHERESNKGYEAEGPRIVHAVKERLHSRRGDSH